jgi:hypothetical protein
MTSSSSSSSFFSRLDELVVFHHGSYDVIGPVAPTFGTRRMSRKERAAAARKLFRSLGLKGLSVTAPNYSMASSVHIEMPAGPEGLSDYERRMVRASARSKLQALLLVAFPGTEDRSDIMTDYFDFVWSFR